MESFDDLPHNEDAISGLIDCYPDWLNAMEINTYRSVAMLQHVCLNFDQSITRTWKLQAAKEAT